MTGSGRWNESRVVALAPDASSLAAARRLATPGPWSETGCSDVLVWGRCQGSGKTPYQTSVDLTAPAYRCTCPSRKFPCKHAVALLLLWSAGSVGEGAGDPVAEDWARARAERDAARAGRRDAPPDPAAQARRLAQRIRLMDEGIDAFSLWLRDLVREGVATARGRDYEYWDAQARRLVDAQLPGLAARVREVPGLVAGTPDPTPMLDEIGVWWTIATAWRRRDELDPDDASALRAELGWATPSAEIRDADVQQGDWLVAGVRRTDRGRLTEQRTWLRRLDDGELVLLLDFAAGATPLPVPQLVGARLRASVSRYPGPRPRRAILHEDAVPAGTSSDLGRALTIDAAFSVAADQLARTPWTDRTAVVIAGRVVVADGRARIVDETGDAVRVHPDSEPWTLAAITGGHPAELLGELEQGAFRPLSVALDGRLVAL